MEAGGYPGAGIGGGGAGAGGSTCCTGGCGYTAGSASGNINHNNNGLKGLPYARGNSDGINNSTTDQTYVAGGYFQGTVYSGEEMVLGGYCCNYAIASGHKSGSGGTGGKGGKIDVSENSKIYAFNGNLYSDGTAYKDGVNQCPIYLQAGINIAKYKKEFGKSIVLVSGQTTAVQSGYENKVYAENSTFSPNKILNINTKLGIVGNPLKAVNMAKQGIGTGAGYNELSNGSYKIDATLN